MPHCAPMRLADILFSQGFGTRRECATLVATGAVRVAGSVERDPLAEFATDGLHFEVHGAPWQFHSTLLLMLHKPAGHECSRAPGHHPSVLSLLPAPLRNRGVQPVGRLDEDTTGLLLLTDEGPLLHRLTHPRHKTPKTYEVRTRHPVTEAQVQALLAGVALHGDSEPAVALACTRRGEHALTLVIGEGRYHQVKRMLAAVGNRVEGLHRSAFGALQLPAELAPGAWRVLAPAERAALLGTRPVPSSAP